jgi:hypothetical protein
VPPAKQEAGDGEPLEQMLALEPRVKFGLTAGAAVVPDRKNSRKLSAAITATTYFAATTMVSTY